MAYSGTWIAALTIKIDDKEIDLEELSENNRREIAVAILQGNTRGSFQDLRTISA